MKKKIALLLAVVLILGASVTLAACNASEYKVTIKSTTNGDVKVEKGTVEVKSGDMVAKEADLKVTVKADTNYMLDTLKVGGSAVTVTQGSYTFKLTKDTEVDATFKHMEITAKTLASLGLTVKDAGMGNYVYAAGKVAENVTFEYDIPRAEAQKRFTRVFSVEKVGTAGDASVNKVNLLLSDIDVATEYYGDIWNVLNNISYAKQAGGVLSGTTVESKYFGYWSNATVGNILAAKTSTDTVRSEKIEGMFLADTAGTYKITLSIIDVTDKAAVNWTTPLITSSVTVVVKTA